MRTAQLTNAIRRLANLCPFYNDLYNSYDTNKDKKTTYLEYGDEYLRSIYNGI